MGLIYIIENKINGKVYIGQTTRTLEKRINQHINRSNCNNVSHYLIHEAIITYGIDNFNAYTLEDNIPKEELNNRERYWIEYYNSIAPKGYNIRNGGSDYGQKKVYKINIYTNEIIDIYDSATQASKENNIDLSGLTKVCRQETDTYGGYKWSYEYNIEEALNKKKWKCKRKIYQMDENKRIIREWNSVSEASSSLNVSSSSISNCLIKRNYTCLGYYWCYKDEYDDFVPVNKRKKILQIDKNTNKIIKTWDSASDIESELKFNKSPIYTVCRGNGIQKTAYGYKWKYKEDKDDEKFSTY